MIEFFETSLTEEKLEKRPMKERIESIEGLREKLGDLMLGKVIDSEPNKLTVTLLTEDATSARFVFEVEEKAPHNLVSISIVQRGGHGGGH